VVKVTPNVTTRNAAKKDPNFKHTAPITTFRRKNARPLSVKSGNMSNQTVAMDENDDLSKEEKILLMQSQPQDAMSEEDDDDSSNSSSIDGMRGMKNSGMIPRTPDKKQACAKLPDTLPDDSSDDDDDDHFGV